MRQFSNIFDYPQSETYPMFSEEKCCSMGVMFEAEVELITSYGIQQK